MLRAVRGLSAELADGRRVRLDPTDPRSAGFAQILDALSKQGMPVYLEAACTSSRKTIRTAP